MRLLESFAAVSDEGLGVTEVLNKWSILAQFSMFCKDSGISPLKDIF